MLEQHPDLLELPDDEALGSRATRATPPSSPRSATSLEEFGVHFDVWFSERSLHEGGAVEQALAGLREQGHVFDSEGAIWLRTTDFSDDKDRVMIRGDGETTYFAADAAYYLYKRERGFDEMIYLLGADHHGYINRLKAIAACAGDDPEHNIEVLIGQLVNVGRRQRLSKRAGQHHRRCDDLVEWSGSTPPGTRWPATPPTRRSRSTARRCTSRPTTTRSSTCSTRTPAPRTSRLAGERRRHRAGGFDAGLLADATEAALLGAPRRLPAVVAQAADLREPHRVARYLEDLAATSTAGTTTAGCA